MRVVVLGASGGVGAHVVPLARAAGHEVVALVRPSTPYETPAGVSVVRAEPRDKGALAAALAGAGAVLCSVGMKRTNPKNPWSKSLSPPDLTSSLARTLVDAMSTTRVQRIVAVSAAGVGDSAAGLNAVMRFMLATTMIGTAYSDLAVMEGIFAGSGLDWLAPRPTRLTDGPRTGAVRVVKNFGAAAAISRADVADFMVRALAVDTWPAASWGGRTPQISSSGAAREDVRALP